jgi:Tfp pilus assembly protein PilO
MTVLGVGAAGAAAVFLLVMPMQRQIEADGAAIEQRRTELVTLDLVTRRITDVQDEIRRLETALASFEGRVPQQREIDVILREVWRIAEARSMLTRSVRTTSPETMPRYSSLPIMISQEGTFEGFYQFLLDLERLPRLTKVRQLQIAKSPADERLVHVDLLMDIFFEKQE